MGVALVHRRLAVGMGLAGLLAFAGGAGIQPVSGGLAGLALLLALIWHPGPGLSSRLEKVWLPLAVVLVCRAVLHLTILGGDVVIPVVDLLLLLLCAEALRSLESPNDARLYALSFALILASTAYRPGLLFAIAFAAYLVLATVALTVGHVRRQAIRFNAETPELGGRFLLWSASLSSIVFVVATAVFLTFPRASNAWSGRGSGPAQSIVGFSDVVSLGEHGGGSIGSNSEIVLRVEFPGGPPTNPETLLWRGRSYDFFDGQRWRRSRQTRSPLPLPDWHRRWGGPEVEHTVFGSRLDQPVLFTLHPVVRQRSRSRIQPVFDQWGDLAYWGGDTPIYTAWSIAGLPHPDSLRAVEQIVSTSQEPYLQLPVFDRSDELRALADSVTAGVTSTYDRAERIEAWLKTFRYTRELPRTAREAKLEHFLFERQAGHCEYFSSAMVVLLRYLGVPARNVNGFSGGEWSGFGDYLAVSQNEAHSWVEVWFEGYGWVPFDPTPAGGIGDGAFQSIHWPGRFFFDALQHSWGKWILDYNLGAQSDLFGRMLGSSDTGTRGGTGRLPMGITVLLAALVAVGTAATLTRTTGSTASAESRIYSKLVASCRKGGILPSGPITATELLDQLEFASHPASMPARSLIAPYLAARFGGQPLTPDERRQMRTNLRLARKLLRRSSAE